LKTRAGERQGPFSVDKGSVEPSAGLRILLVSREYPPQTAWGGIGVYTYNLAQGLSALGHTVHVICQSLDKDKECSDGNIHIHRIAHVGFFSNKMFLVEFFLRLEYSYRVARKINEIIDRHDIDIVEVPNFSAEGFIYSLRKKIPMVTRLHSSFYEVIRAYRWPMTIDRRLSCFLEDASILHSDLVTSSTNTCSRAMVERLGLGKVAVIPLGIAMPALSRAKDDKPRTDASQVLFVGRLERRKGAHVLIKAIPIVLEAVPNVVFTIAGRDTFVDIKQSTFEGSKTNSFKEYLIEQLPEAHRSKVMFLGYLEEESLGACYDACDLFVAPSLYETFGIVYLEAMAHGKPAVGCRVGGTVEVIVDRKTGLLVPPEDPEALAKGIICLLKDARLRQDMGKAAREHVEQSFTRAIMAANTVSAYRAVLSKGKRHQNENTSSRS
jgi:glycosyltransferase involved in cell wall biosynthesis